MAWEEIDLTSVSTDNDLLPEEVDYVWELLPGAKFGRFDLERVEAAGKVASGEFAGRVKYFSYPDPKKQSWSPGVFVRMTKAIGIELEDGEGPVDYLNRVAGNHFVAPVKHRMVSYEGADTTKDEIKITNVKAVRKAA
jgi:hypothetical protein